MNKQNQEMKIVKQDNEDLGKMNKILIK